MKMMLNPTGLEHSPPFVDQYDESHLKKNPDP